MLETVFNMLWVEFQEPVTNYLCEEFGKALGARRFAEHAGAADEDTAHTPAPLYTRFRRHWLRTMYPHDLSYWKTIQNKWYWPQAFASMFPFYGVAPIYWILTFALLERSDEFQLCQFICQFKGLMAFTSGICGMLYGSLRAAFAMAALLECVDRQAHGAMDAVGAMHSAGAIDTVAAMNSAGATAGSLSAGGGIDGCHLLLGWPGGWGSFPLEVFCFVLEVVAVWAAFLILPDSNNDASRLDKRLESISPSSSHRDVVKQQLAERANDSGQPPAAATPTPRGARQRGGLLRRWFGYELAISALCVSIALADYMRLTGRVRAVSWWRWWEPFEGWGQLESLEIRATIYWCRILYALLSLPYVIFTIPLFDVALTHARPTGYDPHGACVRMLTASERQDLRRANKVVRGANLLRSLSSTFTKQLCFGALHVHSKQQRAAREYAPVLAAKVFSSYHRHCKLMVARGEESLSTSPVPCTSPADAHARDAGRQLAMRTALLRLAWVTQHRRAPVEAHGAGDTSAIEIEGGAARDAVCSVGPNGLTAAAAAAAAASGPRTEGGLIGGVLGQLRHLVPAAAAWSQLPDEEGLDVDLESPAHVEQGVEPRTALVTAGREQQQQGPAGHHPGAVRRGVAYPADPDPSRRPLLL